MVNVEKLCCLVRSSSEDDALPEWEEAYMEGGHFIVRMVEKASEVASSILNVSSKLETTKAVYSRYLNPEGIVDFQSFNSESQRALLTDLKGIDGEINNLNRSMRRIRSEFDFHIVTHFSANLAFNVQTFLAAMAENDKNLVALSQNMEQFRSKVNRAIPFYRARCVIL